ncbi:hypothetical protein DFH28DRAFT_910116 [Melampsora americana]|nr:hypothetical protein DFH28DRAFT_910116 [Melampsora americana]
MSSSINGNQIGHESPIVSKSSEKCEWTSDQEKKMIESLTIVHQNNKSNKGFSKATWSAIALELKGTEGSSKVKTGDACLAHYNILAKRYRDVVLLLKKSGAGWNEQTKMVELQPAIWEEMAQSKTGVNKRLGWFRRNSFPLYDAVGAIVDPGMAKGSNRIDSFALVDPVPPSNLDNAIGDKGKADDTSSGKSMSHDDSDSGSLDTNRINLAIGSDADSPPPTSTSQVRNPNVIKSKSNFKRRRHQSSETEDTRSHFKTRKQNYKRPRKSAAQAGEDFIVGLDSISDKLITHMSNDTSALASGSSAQPYDFLTSATQGLRKLGLTEDELYDAMDLLKKDVDYAKMFVGLGDIELQLNWIKRKLSGK